MNAPRAVRWLAVAIGLALPVAYAGVPVGVRAQEAEPSFVALAGGVFDMFDDEIAGEFRAEYRPAWRHWDIAPFFGVMVTTDGAFYGYGGVGLDLYLGENFVLTPNAAVGLYGEGDGKDLGGPVEFRTGLEIAYRFEDHARLGIAFNHISNAGLYDPNSGEESLVLVYALPLGD